MSDGSIIDKRTTLKLQLQVTDMDYLEAFVEHIREIFPDKNPKIGLDRAAKKNCKAVYRAGLHSIDFCTWVRNITDYKNKIPDCVLHSSVENKTWFLSGLYDGDGSAYVSKNGHVFSSFEITSEWINEVRKLFQDIGIKVGKLSNTKITSGGKQARRFYMRVQTMYDFPIHIARKREAIEYHKNNKKKYSLS